MSLNIAYKCFIIAILHHRHCAIFKSNAYHDPHALIGGLFQNEGASNPAGAIMDGTINDTINALIGGLFQNEGASNPAAR